MAFDKLGRFFGISNDDELENLITDIESNNAEIEDLLHEMGVKDIDKLLAGDYSDLDLE